MKHLPVNLKIELGVDIVDYLTIETFNAKRISLNLSSPDRIYEKIAEHYLYDFFRKYRTIDETKIKDFLVKIFQWFNIKCTPSDFEIKYNKSEDIFKQALKKYGKYEYLYYYNPELETEENEDFKELNEEVK